MHAELRALNILKQQHAITLSHLRVEIVGTHTALAGVALRHFRVVLLAVGSLHVGLAAGRHDVFGAGEGPEGWLDAEGCR